MTGIGLVVLTRQQEDLDLLGIVKQVGDEGVALVRFVLARWQAKIDEGQRRRRLQLGEQAFDLGARFRHKDLEIAGQDEMQGVGDDRVVIDDQKSRFGIAHGSTS